MLLAFLDFTSSGLLAGLGALFAGLGAFLSGIAALKLAQRKGEEKAREARDPAR